MRVATHTLSLQPIEADLSKKCSKFKEMQELFVAAWIGTSSIRIGSWML